MRLKLISWNGHNINDGTNYEAVIQPGNAMPSATAVFIDVGQGNPVLTGKTLDGGYFTLHVVLRGSIESQRDQLNEWFRTDDFTVHQLIAYDLDDSNKSWYLEGYPVTPPLIADESTAKYSITLALSSPYWQESSSTPTTQNATGSTTNFNVVNSGNAAAYPVITITPRASKGGTPLNVNRFFISVRPTPHATPETDPLAYRFGVIPIDLTPLGWNTAALISAGKMRSDGYDVRVIVNGLEVPRWFGGGGINTATTHLWVNINLISMPTFDLETAMDGATTPASISVISPDRSQPAFDATKGTLLIGNELVKYTGGSFEYISDPIYVRKKRYTFTGLTRAANGSTIAAHSAGADVFWIQNDIWVVYGNASATNPAYPDDQRPAIDLVNSTNTEWIFNDQFSPTGSTSPHVYSNTPKAFGPGLSYTAVNNAGANEANIVFPYAVVGLKLISKTISGIVYSDTDSKPLWMFYHPGGIEEFQYIGERYRSGAQAGVAILSQRTNGLNGYTVLHTITTPVAAGGWEAISGIINTSDTPQSNIVDFRFSGGLGTTLPVPYAMVELNYIRMNFHKPPLVFIPIPEGVNYELSGYIENAANDHRITLRNIPIQLDETVTIDCAEQDAYLSDGRNLRGFLSFDGPVRDEWMALETGTNAITFYDANTTDVDISVAIRARGTV